MFSCHTWTQTPQLIVGSEDGRILVFSPIGELVSEITNFHGRDQTVCPVTCLLTTTKGVVAAGTMGAVSIYERGDETLTSSSSNPSDTDKERKFSHFPSEMKKNSNVGGATTVQMTEVLKKSRELTLPDENSRICNMAVCGTEDELVCSTDGGQMYIVVMASAEIKVC